MKIQFVYTHAESGKARVEEFETGHVCVDPSSIGFTTTDSDYGTVLSLPSRRVNDRGEILTHVNILPQ